MLDITRAYGLNFLFPQRDERVGPSLRDHGEFSKVEVELAAAYMRLTEVGAFIDVGANIGAVCLPIAARFPNRRVIAIEGHIGLAQVVGTNAFANGLYNVEVMHAVAGPEIGLSQFSDIPLSAKGNFGGMAMSHVGGGQRNGNVRMCTLDEVAPPDTAFVKVDVEGFEPSVLAGAGRVLQATRPTWIIETGRDMEEQARKTIRIMLGAGYDVYWLFVPFVTRMTGKPATPPTAIMGDVNILAVPKGGPNIWDLRAVESADAPLPNDLAEMPYLARFGYSHSKWTS